MNFVELVLGYLRTSDERLGCTASNDQITRNSELITFCQKMVVSQFKLSS